MATIEIEDMTFYAYHGCFEEEAKIGTNFRVDLEIKCDTSKSEISDNINDTVSYLDVYQTLKKEMEEPSHLLEHVSRRIINTIFKEYPSVEYCKVKVTKKNPPLGGKMLGVSVSLEEHRPSEALV